MRQRQSSRRPLSGASGVAPRIVVQLSLAPPDGTTKYVDQLVDEASGVVENVFFTWRRALRGRYDVFHVHWPELMIRAPRRAKAFARRRALDAFLLMLRIRRIPLVRTVHNLAPHEEGPRAERRSLARVDRATTLYITLNETTPLPTDRPAVLIPHGHYRDRFARWPLPEAVPGRILYFGIIRPYKGVVELVDTFRSWPSRERSLRIVGATAPGMDAEVADHAAGDGRISTRFAFVEDEELVAELGAAQLVVLPYREMHNSGAILVALSLARPVLVPATAAMRAMREEVGGEWVMLYEGDLDAATLARATEWARDVRTAVPDLSGRDWARVRALHAAAYREALALRRGATQRGAEAVEVSADLGVWGGRLPAVGTE